MQILQTYAINLISLLFLFSDGLLIIHSSSDDPKGMENFPFAQNMQEQNTMIKVFPLPSLCSLQLYRFGRNHFPRELLLLNRNKIIFWQYDEISIIRLHFNLSDWTSAHVIKQRLPPTLPGLRGFYFGESKHGLYSSLWLLVSVFLEHCHCPLFLVPFHVFFGTLIISTNNLPATLLLCQISLKQHIVNTTVWTSEQVSVLQYIWPSTSPTL